jgi:hypothetical protein
MERGGKVNYYRELNDTAKDRKIIDSVLERFESYDSFEVDATKAKKFVEEKRHKIKRPSKKPTKITETVDKKTNESSKIPKSSEINTYFKFNSEDDKDEDKKLKPKKPTKIKETLKEYDKDDDKKLKSKKPTKIKEVNSNDEDDDQSEQSLSKIQLLNQELFKENSNKSRNEDIKSAWKTLQEYKLPDKDNLIIKKSHPGHFVSQGWCYGSIRNPHWLVKDNSEEEYYIMNCGNDNYTKFSVDDYIDVINPQSNIYPTWTKCKNGYIDTHSYITTGNRIYLHQVICKKYNEKKYSTLSVDHKNRDKLDNRNHNLRFATQSEQNQNTDKRNRKYNAKKLPEGLKQEDMPKYVLYYSEMYGTNKDKFREWLNIEKHPKQNGKRWSTSKSMAVSIQEKLEQAKAKLEELDL